MPAAITGITDQTSVTIDTMAMLAKSIECGLSTELVRSLEVYSKAHTIESILSTQHIYSNDKFATM